MAQTWNDVLQHIKINLGVPFNKLEISDDDLVELLKNQVLPYFSQYAARKKFKAISSVDLMSTTSGQPIYQYKIPLDTEEYIIDVLNFYASNKQTILDASVPLISSPDQVIDTVIYNSYLDIVKSMQIYNTWEFFPPDILVFDSDVTFGILEYSTVHQELKTIEPDKYHLMFKKLCLANVKVWLAAMRSKFENLSTQFGPIVLNWETLKQEGQQEKEEVTQLLTMIPPDFLVHIDV
jgi:hypothetical protein